MDRHCIECRHEIKSVYEFPCTECVYNGGDDDMSEPKITTNADRIRSMTDEELAEFLKEYFSCEYGCPAHKTACICDCNEAIIKWLQKECEV